MENYRPGALTVTDAALRRFGFEWPEFSSQLGPFRSQQCCVPYAVIFDCFILCNFESVGRTGSILKGDNADLDDINYGYRMHWIEEIRSLIRSRGRHFRWQDLVLESMFFFNDQESADDTAAKDTMLAVETLHETDQMLQEMLGNRTTELKGVGNYPGASVVTMNEEEFIEAASEDLNSPGSIVFLENLALLSEVRESNPDNLSKKLCERRLGLLCSISQGVDPDQGMRYVPSVRCDVDYHALQLILDAAHESMGLDFPYTASEEGNRGHRKRPEDGAEYYESGSGSLPSSLGMLHLKELGYLAKIPDFFKYKVATSQLDRNFSSRPDPFLQDPKIRFILDLSENYEMRTARDRHELSFSSEFGVFSIIRIAIGIASVRTLHLVRSQRWYFVIENHRSRRYLLNDEGPDFRDSVSRVVAHDPGLGQRKAHHELSRALQELVLDSHNLESDPLPHLSGWTDILFRIEWENDLDTAVDRTGTQESEHLISFQFRTRLDRIECRIVGGAPVDWVPLTDPEAVNQLSLYVTRAVFGGLSGTIGSRGNHV